MHMHMTIVLLSTDIQGFSSTGGFLSQMEVGSWVEWKRGRAGFRQKKCIKSYILSERCPCCGRGVNLFLCPGAEDASKSLFAGLDAAPWGRSIQMLPCLSAVWFLSRKEGVNSFVQIAQARHRGT